MKIGIIGATGHAGSALLKEALKRNEDVTAIVRSPQKLTVSVPYIKKDLYDLTTEDLQDFDVVFDAFRAPVGHEEMHRSSLAHLVEILKGTKVHLIIVGGASSMYLDPDKTIRLFDRQDPGAPYYPTASNMYFAYQDLQNVRDVDWTYLSPAMGFFPDMERTGRYQLIDTLAITNAEGKSIVGMADYAIAALDIAEKREYVHGHVGVIS